MYPSSMSQFDFPLLGKMTFLFGSMAFPVWVKFAFLYKITYPPSMSQFVYPLWDNAPFLYGLMCLPSSIGRYALPLWPQSMENCVIPLSVNFAFLLLLDNMPWFYGAICRSLMGKYALLLVGKCVHNLWSNAPFRVQKGSPLNSLM